MGNWCWTIDKAVWPMTKNEEDNTAVPMSQITETTDTMNPLAINLT